MSKRANYDVDKWLAMYEDGMTQEEIGLEVGISQSTIGIQLKKHPDYVPRPAKKPPEQPLGNVANKQYTPKSPIKKATLFPSTRGHRRRSRY